MSVDEITAPARPLRPSVQNDEMRSRLRRVEGQVRGIERMIEAGRACPDIMGQVSAARAALASVARELVLADARRSGMDPTGPEYASLVRSLEALGGGS